MICLEQDGAGLQGVRDVVYTVLVSGLEKGAQTALCVQRLKVSGEAEALLKGLADVQAVSEDGEGDPGDLRYDDLFIYQAESATDPVRTTSRCHKGRRYLETVCAYRMQLFKMPDSPPPIGACRVR